MKLHYTLYACLLLGGLNLMAAQQLPGADAPRRYDTEVARIAFQNEMLKIQALQKKVDDCVAQEDAKTLSALLDEHNNNAPLRGIICAGLDQLANPEEERQKEAKRASTSFLPLDPDAIEEEVADIVRRTPVRGATLVEQLDVTAKDLNDIESEIVAIPNNPQKLQMCSRALNNIIRNFDRLRLEVNPRHLTEADAERRSKLLAQAERLKATVEEEQAKPVANIQFRIADPSDNHRELQSRWAAKKTIGTMVGIIGSILAGIAVWYFWNKPAATVH